MHVVLSLSRELVYPYLCNAKTALWWDVSLYDHTLSYYEDSLSLYENTLLLNDDHLSFNDETL